MARSERLVLAASFGAAIVACNVIAGIDQFHDVPCAPCDEAGGSLEASSFPGDSPGDVPSPEDAGGGADATDADAGDDAADADATLDAGTDADADAEGGSFASPEASVDHRWPLWRMPNAAGSGLPNEAGYAPVAATDGGVLDLITGLAWESAPFPTKTRGGALSACVYPARLPTRIELVSILDTSQPVVLVNPAFTAVKAAGAAIYWTSSTAPDGSLWTVDFGTGIVAPADDGNAVLCVQAGDGGVP